MGRLRHASVDFGGPDRFARLQVESIDVPMVHIIGSRAFSPPIPTAFRRFDITVARDRCDKNQSPGNDRRTPRKPRNRCTPGNILRCAPLLRKIRIVADDASSSWPSELRPLLSTCKPGVSDNSQPKHQCTDQSCDATDRPSHRYLPDQNPHPNLPCKVQFHDIIRSVPRT